MAGFQIVQDIDQSISVMKNAGEWMERNNLPPSIWWKPENMNRDFLLKHTEPGEYYAGLINGVPAASMILQETQRNQSWHSIDGDKQKKALYVHWLCVHRDFAGQNLSARMVQYAKNEAVKRGFRFLRLDTRADEKKLCRLYEQMGFVLMGSEKNNDHRTAFYQIGLPGRIIH